MKKKIMITVSSVAIAAVLGLGIYHSNAAQAAPELSKADIEALVQAQYPGTITELELEKGFNKVVYEVEVQSNGKEFELKLDGNTGEVLKLEEKETKVANNTSTSDLKITEKESSKSDDDSDDQSKTKAPEKVAKSDENKVEKSKEVKKDEKPIDTNKSTKSDERKQKSKEKPKRAVIDHATAKKIALAEFPGTIKELELDEDDGRLIYEVEIESEKGEAEIEIDAYTGEIINISIDRNDVQDDDDHNDNDNDDDDHNDD